MGVLKQFCDHLDALVHPSAQADPITKARHRAFSAPRLLGSLVALVAFPAFLALRGAPSVTELLVFCWLLAPILTSYYLSRTGRYEKAHMASSLALAALVTTVAAKTGGIQSIAAIWLVVVPLEAALSASRRVVVAALTVALAAAGLLLFMDVAGMLPNPEQGAGALAALGVISASLYATGLALGAESLSRTDFSLFRSEDERYRLLARNMSDAISRHGRNGAVLFVSPAAERLFGASIAELNGFGLFNRVHIADRPAYMSALAHAAAQSEACSVEFRVRCDSGDPAIPAHFIWIEMRCRSLDGGAASASGNDTGDVVAVLRDVTERKEREHEREAAHADAERGAAAKGRFLAVMSHELRTPLNVIIGFSDMLISEKAMALGPDRRNEYARLINESGHHLLAVVNDILAMAKLETGEFEIRPEPLALAAIVASSCDLLALKARDSGVQLAFNIEADLPPINADKRALKQILINLLSNAIKFTDRGGHVAVGAKRDGADVVISVEDDGIGIREADLLRVGDPFFQSADCRDRVRDGTGLGLSIVKALVGLHGGELSITSRIGAGTRVVVRIPLDYESATAAKSGSLNKSTATVTRLATPADAVSEAPIPVKKRA
ncbi:MAG: PAS domain-containing sensor histidine kinase [Rhodoplanes sp.]